MTKSKDKATNGFVKVAIDREEFFINPANLKIGKKTLADILAEQEKLKKEFAEYVKVTNLTLAELTTTNKRYKKEIDGHTKLIEEIMTELLKGGV